MHLASLAKVRADRDATIPLEEELAMASNGSRYYVGGLLLPRPFKFRPSWLDADLVSQSTSAGDASSARVESRRK